MQMIDRVASAIHLALTQSAPTWEELPDAQRTIFQEAARKAIHALRSPSDAMLAEGGRRDLPHDAANLWERMIYRALTD